MHEYEISYGYTQTSNKSLRKSFHSKERLRRTSVLTYRFFLTGQKY